MRWTVTKVVLIPATLVAMSCKTADPSGSVRMAFVTNGERASRPVSDRLGYVEIASARVANAHEAVSRLRPEFLRRRSTMINGDGQPVVYLNGVRQGGADMLRSIPAGAVYEIRFLSATAASAEFGRTHPGGVISVRSSPERAP